MEYWEDQGIILSVRPHSEHGAVVSLLTEAHGRHAGYVRGVSSGKTRGTYETGNLVDACWRARVSDNLGAYTLELCRSYGSKVMDDPLRLGALQSACALCEDTLPEREAHPGLYRGLVALFETLESEVWAQVYVMWEIALLRELGFSLDLSRCAGGGDAHKLAYVSPKTGRAVSYEAGEPYRDKLLDMPGFLKPNGGPGDDADILTGLKLTGYFLEHWAFAHHTRGLPEARVRLLERVEHVYCKATTGIG